MRRPSPSAAPSALAPRRLAPRAQVGQRARLGLLGGLAVGALAAAPGAAQACGGLFCDNTQPVTQNAERILFGRDGSTMHMVVGLTYQGPPVDFGWLLPVPADVETRIGSATLFARFDQTLAPTFQLQVQFDPACFDLQSRNQGDSSSFPEGGGGEGGGGGGGGGSSINVLAREIVGPYDQVVLRADSVADLREWLTTHEFQYPEGSDALLQTYVDLGSAFLALRLVADATADDVVPLHLTFTSDSPAIPLRPTAVAADPDMGILVHLIGPGRAVPTNYRHVQINEAAIDWLGNGANYTDVVSQAVDEAGGRAFVTDAAVAIPEFPLWIPSPMAIEAVRAADTINALIATGIPLNDGDVGTVLARHVTPPAGLSAADFLACVTCAPGGGSAAVDGPALADDLEAEVQATRVLLADLFHKSTSITRLFTTMSAHEMLEDPIFDFNRDLPGVPPGRAATQHVSCDAEGNFQFDRAVIELADGRRVATGERAPPLIQRQDGLTVRGADTVAAAVVEQMFTAGQPEIIDDRRPALRAQDQPALPSSPAAAGDGCDCAVTADPTPPTAGLLGLLALLGLSGRRRRR